MAFIVGEKASKSIKFYDTYSERIILCKLKEEHHDTLIIQIYAPSTDYSEEDIEQFYDDLSNVVKQNKKWSDKLIICGDFNAKIGKEREEKIVGPYGLGERNNSGDKLVEFCRRNDLFVTNTWFEQKETARHTWVSPGDRCRNQIDYILCSQRYRNSILNSKVRHGADCASDHKPVVITTRTKLKTIKRKLSSIKWNLNILKLNEGKYVNATDEKVKNYQKEKMDTNQKWIRIKNTIKDAAMEVIGKKRREKKQQWMTEDILDLMEERRTKKDSLSRLEYRNLTGEIQRKCRKAKDDYYNSKCTEIEQLDMCHSNKKYQKIKEMQAPKSSVNLGIQNKQGEILHNDSDILRRWEEYIGEELYNDTRAEKPNGETTDDLSEITMEEMERAINSLAKGKAAGEDEIPAELLQALGPNGKEELRELTNDIYKTGTLPKDFTVGVYIPIPKVNKATKCSDHRTISLISHASKILLKIIMERINPIINRHLDETQLGFRKGKGTRDGIFLLRNISERMAEHQKDLFLCFIDYSKAFDRVNHAKMMEVLTLAGVADHERRLIAELYWNQTAKVRTDAETTDEINILRGVRQGCILSPSLFNLYSEFLLQEALGEKKGISLNGENITNVRYADDTVILAETPEDLQLMLDGISESCKTYGMAMNAKKTKTMHVGKEKKKITMMIDGSPLEQVAKYQYLGHMLTEDVSTKKEIDIRTEKARAAFWKHKELLRRNVNIETKKRILKCYVFSVLNYGCETWTFTKAVKDKIRSFEMWCYRRILRISWKEHKTNKEVLHTVVVKERLLEQLIKRKMRYAGHVIRGSSGHLLQLALEGRIEGRRGRGRPKRSWTDDIKEWTQCHTYGHVKRKAEKKLEWRTMVANLRTEEGT